MIRITIVRHAKPDTSSPSDDPPLSAEGEETHRMITDRLKEKGVQPTEIYSSPKRRAVQTAEIMGSTYGLSVTQDKILDGESKTEAIIEWLQDAQPGDAICLVGHLPNVSDLANQLSSTKMNVEVVKSGCILLNFPGRIAKGEGEMIEYIHP
jgi:phosphohistidine phosphatase